MTRSTTALTPPVTRRERSTGEGGGKGNRVREAPYIGEGFRWGEEEEKGGRTFSESARACQGWQNRPALPPNPPARARRMPGSGKTEGGGACRGMQERERERGGFAYRGLGRATVK
jgi:hypothetical protein